MITKMAMKKYGQLLSPSLIFFSLSLALSLPLPLSFLYPYFIPSALTVRLVCCLQTGADVYAYGAHVVALAWFHKARDR